MADRSPLRPKELATLLAIAALPFLPGLQRGLVSEDFIILRRIWEQPFWSLTWEQIRGPWMGATLVLFWRPLSTLALQLQELVWGVHPLGYLVILLAAHLLNAALLFVLVRRLFPEEKWPARTVCLIFALYPLHPNSVLFIASFATVYATTLGFASLVLLVEGRRRDKKLLLAGSVLSFGLSLACYEAALILPALLITVDLLWSREREEPLRLKALAWRHLPFIALAAGYLILRHQLLGTTVGGYSGSDFQLGSLLVLLRRLQPKWSLLLAPVYAWPRPSWLELAFRLALLVVVGTLLLRKGARSGRILLGLVWIMAARLPFGDTGIVPGNGRYWYVAAGGIGFLAVGIAELLPRPRLREHLVAVVTVLISLAYGVGLTHYVHQYIAASQLVRKIRSQGPRLADPGNPGAARFLIGVPAFITDARRHNVAQVFAWGLGDAFSPPFAKAGIRAFPLGSLHLEEIGPLASRADLGSVWRWTGTTFSRLSVQPRQLATIKVKTISDLRQGVLFQASGDTTHRVITVGRMNPAVTPAPPCEGWCRAPLPVPFIQSVWHLYGDELYAWVEGSDSKGRPVAASRVLRLSPGS